MEKQDECTRPSIWVRNETEENYEHAATIKSLRLVQAKFYSMCVSHGLTQSIGPFLEFSGLMSKYIDIIERATVAGIDPCSIDGNDDLELPIEPHDMVYLGEKLKRVFGPVIAGSPVAKLTLYNTLFVPETR